MGDKILFVRLAETQIKDIRSEAYQEIIVAHHQQ
jgi:hypothetical protein